MNPQCNFSLVLQWDNMWLYSSLPFELHANRTQCEHNRARQAKKGFRFSCALVSSFTVLLSLGSITRQHTRNWRAVLIINLWSDSIGFTRVPELSEPIVRRSITSFGLPMIGLLKWGVTCSACTSWLMYCKSVGTSKLCLPRFVL